MSDNSINRLTIIAVAHLCAEIAARSEALFEFCGRQVTATEAGRQQRWWATASHRHAADAQLARDRMPTVPVVDAVALIAEATERGNLVVEATDPLQSWLRSVEALKTTMSDARAEINTELDPSTARLLDVVEADLRGLGLVVLADRG